MIPNEGVGGLRDIPGINMTSRLSHMFTYDEPIVVDDSLMERIEDFVTPINGLNAGTSGIYEFSLPPLHDSFLMLDKSFLYIKCQILKGDNANCIETDNFSIMNNFGHSLFSRCVVLFNGIDVMPHVSDHVNYKSYAECVLSYESDTARETNLVNNIFHMDSAGYYENFNLKTKNDKGEEVSYNKGYHMRRRHCENSRIFDLAPSVPHPFFRIDKALAPNIRLGVKFTRASDDWVILSDEGNKYKVKLLDFRLHYHRVRGSKDALEAKLEKYQFTSTELRLFPLPSAMTTYVIPISIGGIVPKQMVIWATDTAAVNGTPGKNPFYFQHYDLEYLALKINDKLYPPDGLRPDFSNTPALVMRELRHLKANTGFIGTDRGNCVTYQQFCNGTTVFAFDTTHDLCNCRHLHPSEVGTISGIFKWKNPLPNAITVFVYMVYDSFLTHVPANQYFQLNYV